MARTFRRNRQAQPIAELNVTNLIDLGFTLLIIFMVTAPLINNQEQAIHVNLPVVAKSAQKPDESDRFVVITVDARGDYFLEGNPSPVGLPELRTRLAVYAAESKPPVIRVRGDENVPYKKIAQLMGELQKANLMRTSLGTESEER